VDVHSKKIFEINNKYYFEDWGLRNALIGLNRFSVPDILENVVFSHLKILGYKLSVGVMKNLEIDFIAEKPDEKIYIQVAYIITDEKVKQREFGHLLQIKDNYPKYVVSLDPVQIGGVKGVKHIHLREFLTKNKFEL
jgi:predicted AAA+ superfamily ATPase